MRVQFSKYFIVGISAVILDIWTLRLLMVYLGFGPILSIIINQLFLLNFVFFFNKYWAFGGRGITHQQAIRFYMVAGTNYLVAIGWMWFFTNLINLHQYIGYFGISEVNYYLIVRIVNMALAVSWNFLLYKFFVYRLEGEDVNKSIIEAGI